MDLDDLRAQQAEAIATKVLGQTQLTRVKQMGNPHYYEFHGRRRKRHLAKAKFPGFDKCLQMMRSHDGEMREDGFAWIGQHASQYVNELVAAFEDEDNCGLRVGLIELIAEAKSSEAFKFLAKQLRSDDWIFRRYAIVGLKNLDTKEARTLLWEAKSFEMETKKETERFRIQLKFPDSSFVD